MRGGEGRGGEEQAHDRNVTEATVRLAFDDSARRGGGGRCPRSSVAGMLKRTSRCTAWPSRRDPRRKGVPLCFLYVHVTVYSGRFLVRAGFLRV